MLEPWRIEGRKGADMYFLHLRSGHTFLLGLVSLGVVLGACQVPDTAPTGIPSAADPLTATVISVAAPPSAPITTSILVAATAVPPSVTPSLVTAPPPVTTAIPT